MSGYAIFSRIKAAYLKLMREEDDKVTFETTKIVLAKKANFVKGFNLYYKKSS